MKIKEGFKIESLAGETIIVATGKMSDTFRNTIVVNNTAAFIFEKLLKNISFDELLSSVVDEYDVDINIARSDVKKVVDEYRSYGIIED